MLNIEARVKRVCFEYALSLLRTSPVAFVNSVVSNHLQEMHQLSASADEK